LRDITPVAAARLGSPAQFLKHAAIEGRRLARLNVPPDDVSLALSAFDRLLDPLLGDHFGPAREQLQLAVRLTLHEAYYQVREAEAQAFFGFYRAEIDALDFDDLLRRFAAILARTFHARTARVLLPGETADPRLLSPLHVEKGSRDEELILDPAMRGRYAVCWSFPLEGGAVAQFGFDRDARWLPRDIALAQAAAGRCREAAERIRLARQVRRLEAEAQRAEEEERRRIGRELHDEAGQSLLLLRLELEMMERIAAEPLRGRLAEARAVAERTVSELRRIVAALSPSVLERLGLESSIRQLGARFRKLCPAKLRIRIALDPQPIPPEMQQVVYRIAQESLNNIAKHSQATHVNFVLETADIGLRLSVSDNGAGFRTADAGLQPASFGIAGMRERAAILGGTLRIDSAPGKGARVRLWLPKPAKVESYDEDSRIDNG
jgi:signal transduction histidine kinase